MTPELLLAGLMTPEEASAWTTPDERAAAAAFGSERRRREFLTWRAVVRRRLGATVRIAYDTLGAPVLPGGEAFVSVSHCEGRVAVCLSDRRCAVDIEPAARNFRRVADRFLTPSESLLSDDPLWPGFAWCAKETLYKYAGRRELDFRRDLHLEAADLAAEHLVGRIADGAPVELTARLVEGFLVVFHL